MAPLPVPLKERRMARTRIKTPIIKTGEVYSSYQYSPIAGTCTSSTPGPLNTQVKSGLGTVNTLSIQENMTDVIIPEYRKRSGRGEIFNNPMTKFRQEEHIDICSLELNYGIDMLLGCSPAKWVHHRDYRYIWNKGVTSLVPYAPIPDYADDLLTKIDQAVAKAHANIGVDKVLAIAMAAEFGKTVSGLAYILKKVFRIYRSVKRAELRRLAKELSFSELQEIYMNARYNLRPLAHDVAGMIEVFSDVPLPGRQTFRASSVLTDSATDSGSYVWLSNSNFSLISPYTQSTYLDISIRAGVLTQIETVTKAQLLGLDKIIETGWELVHFSFIIDWFLNVSEIIGAWTPNFGFKTLTSWVTVNTLLTQLVTFYSPILWEKTVSGQRIHSSNISFSGGTALNITSTVERKPDPTRPIIPSFDIRLDKWKIIDLAIISKKLFKLKSMSNYRV